MSNYKKLFNLIKQECANFKPKKKIALHEPTFGPDEIFAFTKQMITTKVTMGEKVRKFENDFCKKFDFKNGVTSNSGSSANLLMIAALCSKLKKRHLKPGDEVIVPALTWSTSIFPLTQYGLVPVLVDSDVETLNVNIKSIENSITAKTKAILAVHIYGNPCDMDAIEKICKKNNLILIEDACESMGAYYKDKPVGSFGLLSSFSFYFSHHITCMEGGITLSKSFDLAESMRIIRSHGWIRNLEKPQLIKKKYKQIDEKFLFVDEGYNLRLTEPQGVMGSIQLKKLDKFINIRKRNAEYLLSLLNEFSDTFIFQQCRPTDKHSWFGFAFTLRKKQNFSREQICEFLNKKGIETRVIVAGNLALQPALKNFKFKKISSLKNSSYIMNNSFSIGMHQGLNKKSMHYIRDCINNFLNSVKKK